MFGLQETDRQGQSVYLRAYGDYDHCTLKLTQVKQAGLGHVGWRAYSLKDRTLSAANQGK